MNDEKDRFGDFIKLLERAREDVYFAEKDRALLDQLKRRLERVQQGELENPGLKCPRCGVHLNISAIKNLPVNRCSSCGGVWLDRSALRQFMSMETPVLLSETSAQIDSLRNVWPAGLSGMGKSLGGE